MTNEITSILNTIRELPAGEPIRYHAWNGVIGEVVRKKSALTTDDLSQLADYIERVEAEIREQIETEILENLTSYVRRRRKEIREQQSDERNQEIRNYYAEVKSLRQTGKAFGMSHEQVRTIVCEESEGRLSMLGRGRPKRKENK